MPFRKSRAQYFIFVLVLILFFGCKDDKKKKPPVTSIQTYSVWCDASTSLCWQNPQREANNLNDQGLRSEEAILYCEELVLGGFEDWRLPTAKEFRTIVAGYSGTESEGSCGIGHLDDRQVTYIEGFTDGDCGYGDSLNGPGDGGCFTKPGILGTCNKLDPFSFGHYMEFFASDVPSDDSTENPQVATVMFDNAAIVWNHACTVGEVRCVRENAGAPTVSGETAACTADSTETCSCSGAHQSDGYRTCASDGNSWGPCDCATYTPEDTDQPECHEMICDSADSVTLTINVPGWDNSWDPPTQVFAFWYRAETWRFPESRSPDGGTWTNQRIQPELGTPPYTMEVPACTYYQERYLNGDFMLMVILQRDAKFPPIPIGHDFWWGWDQTATTFPLNDTAHTGATENMTISLTRVDDCTNMCTPVPDDSATLSARWSTIYTPDNCIDFPPDQMWTNTEIQTYIEGTPGYETENPATIETGNSCQVDIGGCMVSMRCYVEDPVIGKDMYWYGAPDFVCSSFLDGTYESDAENGEPFCD